MTIEQAEQEALNIEYKATRETIGGKGFEGSLLLVLMDLETTGLIKRSLPLPRIVELAAMYCGKTSSLFSELVHPGRNELIPQRAQEIHHITDEMVAHAPPFRVVATQFIKWVESFSCEQDIIIMAAHNGEKFDKPILIEAFEGVGMSIPSNWRFGDTLPLFRNKLNLHAPKSMKPYALSNLYQSLCKRNIEEAHRAEGDIQALYQCLIRVFHATTEEDVMNKVIAGLMV
jgi:DNA polymerase III alpha subunit (gram-positive type)